MVPIISHTNPLITTCQSSDLQNAYVAALLVLNIESLNVFWRKSLQLPIIIPE
jgi:hypothetical protein